MELTPFTNLQLERTYKLVSFMELGVKVNLLKDVEINELQFGFFRFGVITEEKEMFWFFGGAATVNDRCKAIEVLKSLQDYCNQNKIGTPFLMKVKRFRESYK
jgi:hypothetical protein